MKDNAELWIAGIVSVITCTAMYFLLWLIFGA